MFSLKSATRLSAQSFVRSTQALRRASSKVANLQPTDVVIVSACRTPIGSFGGQFQSFSAPQLGAIAIKGALERGKVAAESVEECVMGNVVGAAVGQAPTRQAAIHGGLKENTVCTGVNKVCASGMKTVSLAAQSIMLGHSNVVVAGGMESMSNIPYYLPKGRFGYRLGHGELVDGIIKDGLTDAFDGSHMGMAGEACATKYSFTREQQDKYASMSYERAILAQENNVFKDEIVPVTIAGKRGGPDKSIDTDEEPGKVDIRKISSLRPAFTKEGTITAANASSINDGASALVLMSAAKAKELGCEPLAVIRGFGDAELAPIDFTVAPAAATPIALKRAGVEAKDIDLWEINEAFSVVVMANMQILNIPHEITNVNGGAVSLGHPIGMSGARIVTHLVHHLRHTNKRFGCASVCNGGGGASAIVIENLA